MNSSTAFGMHGLVPSQIVQLGHTHNARNVINDLWKLQGNSLLVNHQGNSLLGTPTSIGLDHMHQPKVMQEANNIFLSGFSGSGLVNDLCNNSFADMTNNPLSVEANREQTQAGGLGKYSSVRVPYSSLDPFENCLGGSSQFPDLVRGNDTWQDANPLTDYCASTLPMCSPLSSNCSSPSNIGGSVCSIVSNMDGALCGQSSIHVAVAPMHASEIVNGVHGHVGSLGGSMMPIPMDADEDPKFSNFGSLDKSKLKWEEHKQNHGFNPNVIFSSSLNSSLPNLHTNDPTANQILSSTVGNKKMDTVVTGGTTLDTLNLTSSCSINKSTANGQLTHNGAYALETTESHCGIPSADCRYNELVSSMIKLA